MKWKAREFESDFPYSDSYLFTSTRILECVIKQFAKSLDDLQSLTEI